MRVAIRVLSGVLLFLIMASSLFGQSLSLYVINLDGTGLRRILTFSPSVSQVTHLSFSPDSSLIAVSLIQDHRRRLFLLKADGTGLKEVTTSGSPDSWSATFTHDGKKLLFVLEAQNATSNLYSMNLDGTGKTLVKQNVWSAELSSDGLKMVFTRTEITTGNAVFICAADGSNEQRLISHLDIWNPVTSFNPANSNQIFRLQSVIPNGLPTEAETAVDIFNVAQLSSTVVVDKTKSVFLPETPHFSADGREVLFSAVGAPVSPQSPRHPSNIYLIGADGTAIRKITSTDAMVPFFMPVPTPDGKQILFVGNILAR